MKSFLVRSDEVNSVLDKIYNNQFRDDLVNDFDIQFVKNKDRNEIIDSWIYPLMSLIDNAIKNEYYIDNLISIYIGERIHRPFSFNVNTKIKSNYFLSVVEKDIAIYQSFFGHGEIISKFHDFSSVLSVSEHVKIITFGDCLFSQINALNIVKSSPYKFYITSYENYFGAFGNEGWGLDDIDVDALQNVDFVAISPFTYWGMLHFRMLMSEIWNGSDDYVYLERFYYCLMENIVSFVNEIRKNFTGIIFIHNCSGLPWLVDEVTLEHYPWNLYGLCKNKQMAERFVQKINNRMDVFVKNENKVFLIDEKKITADNGRGNCTNNLIPIEIMKVSVFHYDNFAFYLSDNYVSIIKTIFFIKNKKLIFVDFDNTLWNGVMADGSVVHFQKRQQLLKKLSDVGVVLVAVSKNNLNNIRWSEIDLLYDSFTLLKINYESKTTNILRASKQLNISLDHCVFIDDSPEEILFVEQSFPQVTVMDSRSEETWEALEIFYKALDHQSTTNLSRRAMYADKIKRDQMLNAEIKIQDGLYLKLNLSVTVKVNDLHDIARAYELILRTNQFNSSKKINMQDLNAISAGQNKYLYTFHAKDKFGDMGLVGVAVVSVMDEACTVDQFSLSCRAMGFGIEDFMMAYIKENNSLVRFNFLYVKTGKNTVVEKFLSKIGFIFESNGEYLYCHSGDLNVEFPNWISTC